MATLPGRSGSGQARHSWNIEPGEVERADALRAAAVGHVIVKAVNDGRGYDLGPVRELVQWRDQQLRRAA